MLATNEPIALSARRTDGLIRNVLALFGANTAARLIRFAYLVAIARFLPPEEVGVFLYGMAFYLAFVPLTLFGQGLILSTRIGHTRSNLSRIVNHSMSVHLGMLLAIAGVAGAAVLITEPANQAHLLMLFVLAMVGRGLAQWVRGVFVALEQTMWIPRHEVCLRGGEAISGVVALAFGGGLLAICLLHFASLFIEGLISIRRLTRVDGLSFGLGRDRRLLARILRIALPIAFGAFLIQLFPQLSIILVRHVQEDPAAVGQFGFALQFVTALLFLPQAFGWAFLPALSRGFRRGGRQVMALQLAVKLCLLMGTIVALLAVACAPGLITLAAGSAYAEAGDALTILAWALGPYAVMLILSNALNALNGRRIVVAISLVIVVVHAAALALLLPSGPVVAAAASLLLASIVGCVMSCIAVQRRAGIGRADWWLVPLTLGASAAVFWLVLPVPAPLAALAAAPLAGLAIWKLCLLTHDERLLLAEKLPLKQLRRHQEQCPVQERI